MERYSKKQIMMAMENAPVIPVFYNGDVAVVRNVVKACYEGGIRLFEFANRGPAALEVFRELVSIVSSECTGMVLGVGSVSDSANARKFIRLGACFVVGPQYVPSVMRTCRLHRIPYIPGCGTVSEVGRAQRAGCNVCKVFPGDVLGPKFVKALLAPMPWSKLMVTGGVKPEKENLESWFKAGVTSVGMGSNLFPREAVAEGDWKTVTGLCSESLRIIREIR